MIGKCETCGKQGELRPYGRHGEKICFDCAMKNPLGWMIVTEDGKPIKLEKPG